MAILNFGYVQSVLTLIHVLVRLLHLYHATCSEQLGSFPCLLLVLLESVTVTLEEYQHCIQSIHCCLLLSSSES